MRCMLIVCCLLFISKASHAQTSFDAHFNAFKTIAIANNVTLTLDEPSIISTNKKTKIIIYALPNGNTTAQTFGKKLAKDDDWHFDIQHIGAQTQFIRKADTLSNYIVIYAENNLKSWPAWRKKYANSDEQIGVIISNLHDRYKNLNPEIILSGHSGGGSFIFGYINAQTQVPAYINRIGFLDATYGYETDKHQAKLKNWLKTKDKSFQIIAYNDSVVIYNGKPLVSPTGGTWYRSKLMANDLQKDFRLKKTDHPDRLKWNDKKQKIAFSLIKNPGGKIFHTVLVEKNGFIDLIFNGTPLQQVNYKFWHDRAYQAYIL